MNSEDTLVPMYVARQPIMNDASRVFGYELLYRDRADATTAGDAGDRATARVLTDAILSLGLETLTSNKPAFVNFTRQLILSDAASLLPASSLVIEIQHDTTVDEEIVEACKRLRAGGYSLTLDNFVEGGETEPLLPLVQFVKVNVMALSTERVAAIARRLTPKQQLIATRVESAEAHEAAKGAGCRLFQGFYYCAPAMRQTAVISGRQLAYLNLIAALHAPEVNIGDLEEIIKRDVSLTYRTLRSVNSAAFGGGREITSIRQALVLLGIDQIRRWATVWALAGSGSASAPEAMSLALMRARSCEVAGTALAGPEMGGTMFLTGLCSLLDVILNRPLESILSEVNFPADVKDALLGKPTLGRKILDAVIAYERADWDLASETAASIGLDEDVLIKSYREALPWIHTLSRASA
ncbi:MAG: HDOD domain-containing protein [Acidobacteria bacterium]|nr:HDOD domain-containing protein [Acidobacteriota bacterium]